MIEGSDAVKLEAGKQVVYLSKAPHYIPNKIAGLVLIIVGAFFLLPAIFIPIGEMVIVCAGCLIIGFAHLKTAKRNKLLRKLYFEELQRLYEEQQNKENEEPW